MFDIWAATEMQCFATKTCRRALNRSTTIPARRACRDGRRNICLKSQQIYWNSRFWPKSRFHDRTWPCKVACQTNIPRHHARTKMLSGYVSANWRADIANDFQYPELWSNTWLFYPTILLTFFSLRRPGARRELLRQHKESCLQAIPKISSRGKACLGSNSSLGSKRQALKFAEGQTMLHLGSLILRDFHVRP